MEHQKHNIRNPFAGNDNYRCFGCDPGNPIGLHLQFVLEGEEVAATWDPRVEFEGYPGVIHGGIQATLVDEIGAWYVYVVLGTAGLTKSLSVSYQKPALSQEGPYTVRATGERDGQRRAVIHVTLENASGEICSTAECEYVVFSEEIARKRFFFPGREAFLSSDG